MTITRELCKQIDNYAKLPAQGRSDSYGNHLVKELTNQRTKVEAAITTLQSELQELELAGEKLYDLVEVE